MYARKRHETKLTNEQLNKYFSNPFAIVSRAIHIAEYLVASGKAAEEWPDNVANEVLERMTEKGPEAVEIPVEETA